MSNPRSVSEEMLEEKKQFVHGFSGEARKNNGVFKKKLKNRVKSFCSNVKMIDFCQIFMDCRV